MDVLSPTWACQLIQQALVVAMRDVQLMPQPLVLWCGGK